MDNSEITRIALWSGPRNISTALMYSFAQREDTKVFDEPLYAYYLRNTKAKEYHPGAEEILKSQNNNGEEVVKMMLTEDSKPVLFFKNMTHHLLDLDRSFMNQMQNVILTRHPKEMIPSFAKVIDNPTIADIGYAMHTKLLRYFEENNINFTVLDSKQVLLNPKRTLILLCEKLGISFDEKMLSWEPKPRPEDGVWAKYWYKNVHQSNGFGKYEPKLEPFPENLRELLKECQSHYEILKEYSIG